MKYAKFFELAKEAGIQEAELYIHKDYSLRFSIFHGEVDNYSANNGFSVQARGLFNGKFGTASCDVWNLEKAKYLVNEIVTNAKVSKNDDPVFIFSCVEFRNDVISRIFSVYEKKLSRREYRHVDIVCYVCPDKSQE